MAVIKDLTFVGPNSSCLGNEEIEFLGKLLGAMLYNEINVASDLLLNVRSDLVIDIAQAARTLNALADLCYNNKGFLTAILATYRLSHLLPDDEGPLFIFTRIRSFAASMMINENKELGFWANVDSGINCAYCCGLYAAIFVSLLVVWNNFYGNLFILVFAIAGGQSLLQKWSEK
jgi:hypothetical protein